MLQIEVRKPYAVEFMTCATDCLAASAAMVAGGEMGLDAGWLANYLRAALRPCERGGAGMVEAALALRHVGVPAWAMRGHDLRDLAEERHHDGGVVLGVRPSMLYAVPDGPVGHAMVMAAASRPMLPRDVPRGLFGSFVAPIELIDPSPYAPTRRVRVSEVIRDAYDAQGKWALWVPSLGTARTQGWIS